MLARPDRFFADRFGLNSTTLDRLLGDALRGRVDHADVYLEYRVNEELVLEEGAVKKAARHVSQGAGIRAQSGERTGYAHTDDISLATLEEAARQARAIADQAGASGVVAVGPAGQPHDLYTLAEPPIDADIARKVALLRQVDAAARAADARVRQVIATLGSEELVVLIAHPSGLTVGDVRPLTRLNVTVIAEEGGKREVGTFGGGGRVPLDFFSENERWQPPGRGGGAAGRGSSSARVEAPAGTMTVVLGPGGPASSCTRRSATAWRPTSTARGTSAFAGRIGERVASELGTVVDDGTLAEPARLAQRRRRGHADPAQRAHRERRAARLHARPAERRD